MSMYTDWLDYIPIVGTVKNTVECISAYCKGDYKLAKEKGANAALGLLLDVATAGAAHAAETAAVKIVENLAIKGAEKQAVVKAVSSTAKQGAKVAANIATHSTIIQTSKGRGKPQADERRKHSNRGEHVINNHVLKVFKTIIDRFVSRLPGDRHWTASELLRPGTKAFDAYHSPLPEDVTQAIRYEMVAHIPEDEHYIDANSTVYGFAIQNISDMVVEEMLKLYQHKNYDAPSVHRSITDMVYFLNERQVYVDEYAKQYWLEHGGNIAQFENCREHVVRMFSRLCRSADGYEKEYFRWVSELTQNL